MMRSLYSGVTGLKNHQTRMDVIGNNIANVNTTGYKRARADFQDIYSQTISSSSGTLANGLGGVNAKQVGLGVQLASISNLHSQGTAQYTGYNLDLLIDGEGFFILGSRATPDATGGDAYTETYSRAGNLKITADGYLVDSNGYYVMGYAPNTSPSDPPAQANLSAINIPPNEYREVTINDKGEVRGISLATGESTLLGTIVLSSFSNPAGLEKIGHNMYRVSANSGTPQYNQPGVGLSGNLQAGSLEMSNVDLSDEFTDMIVTQRGFQANSRVITVSDTMLEELINLKR